LVILSDDDDKDKIAGSEAKEISKTINKARNTTNTYTRLFNKTTTESSKFFINPTVDYVICS